MIQGEEDHKNVALLNDSVEKLTQKLNVYKRQLQEQVQLLLPPFCDLILIVMLILLAGRYVTAKLEPCPPIPA